jgi:hypothetical protein
MEKMKEEVLEKIQALSTVINERDKSTEKLIETAKRYRLLCESKEVEFADEYLAGIFIAYNDVFF